MRLSRIIFPNTNITNAEQKAVAESAEGRALLDADVPTILSEYRAAMSLPEKQPEHQWVLCVVGLVGSGKTTIVKQLCARLGLVRISTDELRIILRRHDFNLLRTAELAGRVTLDTINAGYSVALDADGIVPERTEKLRAYAKQRGIRIVWIHVNPPEAFILKNNRRRDQAGQWSLIETAVENYLRRKPLHEKYLPSMTFDWVFDPSRPDLDEQITQFIDSIKP